jgi:hypothetical protein
MERSKPTQGPSRGEGAPALLGWGKPAGFGLAGKAGERTTLPNVSAAKRLVLPSGEVINVPEGLAAKVARRFGVVYGVSDHETAVRLVAELLLRVSESSRGSVYYLNGRKLAALLGLQGYLNPFTTSLIYGILSRLDFEIARTAKGATAVISMDKSIMREIKNAKTIEGAVEVVKRYLGE